MGLLVSEATDWHRSVPEVGVGSHRALRPAHDAAGCVPGSWASVGWERLPPHPHGRSCREAETQMGLRRERCRAQGEGPSHPPRAGGAVGAAHPSRGGEKRPLGMTAG